MSSIEDKLKSLKQAFHSVQSQKFNNDQCIDSITLISQNLSRPKKPKSRSTTNDQKITYKTMKQMKQSPKKKSNHASPNSLGLLSKGSPTKTNPADTLFANNFKQIQEEEPMLYLLMKRFYEARCIDMKIQANQSSLQGFAKVFFAKNRHKKQKNTRLTEQQNLLTSQYLKKRQDQQRIIKKLDLSGFNMMENALQLTNQVIISDDYEYIDLSRNIIKIHQIYNIGNMQYLRSLKLNNCGLKNQDLSKLFKLLQNIQIKNLSISSPQIKDRNNLTHYQDLNTLILSSQSLQSLQLQNIQLDPNYPIFQIAKNSKSLLKLDLSKNTGVIGINKKIEDVNLSWNNIKRCDSLILMNTNVKILNLTGNPIAPHVFKTFLLTSYYPCLEVLILNRIPLYSEKTSQNDHGQEKIDKKKVKKGGKNEKAPQKATQKKPHFKEKWLQNFISSTKSLRQLQLIDCSLCQDYIQNISFGLTNNRSIQKIDLSLNKFPDQIMQKLAYGIHKSRVKKLHLYGCDIKDHQGVQLFKDMKNNENIQFLDLSKNSLGTLTSSKICQTLKRNCYNLLDLRTDQNFIKYDQLKQIDGYIDRNVYLMKIKIKEDHKRLTEGIGNEVEIRKKIVETAGILSRLVEQTNQLETQYMQLERNLRKQEILRMEKYLQLIKEQEKTIINKSKALEQEIDELENMQQKQGGEGNKDQ